MACWQIGAINSRCPPCVKGHKLLVDGDLFGAIR